MTETGGGKCGIHTMELKMYKQLIAFISIESWEMGWIIWRGRRIFLTRHIFILLVAIMGSNSVNVVTTIPAIVTAMGWKSLSPGALVIPGVMPNHFYCDPSLVLKTLSSGKGEKGSEKSCQTS